MNEEEEIERDPVGEKKKDSLSKVMNTASTKRVVTGGFILTTVDILGSVFFMMYTIAVSGLSPEVGGILTVVVSFQAMLKYFAMLGFTGAGAKFISEYLERDKEEARKYGISAAKYNFLVVGLPIVTFSVILYFFKRMEGDPLTNQAFLVLIFLMLVDRLRSCSDLYLLAYQRYDLYAIAWGIPYGAMYIGAIFLMKLGPLGPLLAWLIGYLAMFLLSMTCVSKISDFPVRDMFSWHKDYGLFKKMFSFNFLYSLANLCFAMLTTTMFIAAGDSLGILTPQDVQALGVISTFSNILINVFGIVAGIQPAVSQAFALKNRKMVKNYFLTTVKFPLMMTIAVTTFFIIFGQEMIEIFYNTRGDGRYSVIGIFIMVTLIPSYSIGAYASRWDNILAGIGRPETAVIPWFVGMVVAILGIILTWLYVPQGLYLLNNEITINIEGVPTLVNYGITAQFTSGMVSMVAGLVIPGVWIMKITVKVLEINIPRRFLTGPLGAAVLTSIILVPIKMFIPFKTFLENVFSSQVGGIVYTLIMIIGGVLIYLTILILLGGFTKEDGRFWMSVVGTIAIVKFFLFPVFLWGKFWLKRVPRRFQTDEIVWITTTNPEQMAKEMEFIIDDDFDENCGDSLDMGSDISFSIFLREIKQPFYNVIVTIKIDQEPVQDAEVYLDEITQDTKVNLKCRIPKEISSGHHELYINVEMYISKQEGLTFEKMKKSRFRNYFDFRFKWWDEKIKYITIT
ncbi:MAG: hypothetical protein ACTSUE_19150 [Promethearchaeota archaeon]